MKGKNQNKINFDEFEVISLYLSNFSLYYDNSSIDI
jgi:hypothetical protein